MRPIDADALFDEVFKVWGAEADGGETNLFMEMINNAPTIDPSPNDPLTLDELREMDGEPVWITDIVGGVVFREQWALIFSVEEDAIFFSTKERGDDSRPFSLYGTGWLAYRRKPEGD